jgi:hypothetical protein
MSSDAHEEPQRVEEAERQHMRYRDEQNAECTSSRNKGTGGELNYCRQRMRYCDGQNVEYMSTRRKDVPHGQSSYSLLRLRLPRSTTAL